MHLTYKYRMLPTKAQHRALERILEDQRQLYNGALEERIECYRKTGRTPTLIDQQKSLTQWRKEDASARSVATDLQRWTLKRLDDAYTSFLGRLKMRKGKAGFPRFRGKGGWNSFGFREFGGIKCDARRISFKGLASTIRVRIHRPLPGKPCSCVFTRDTKGWTVSFQMKVEESDKRPVTSGIGIDLGLKTFAYQSDGVVIPNPRVARRSERKMRVKQRALSRCKRGSKSRRKVRAQVTRLHAKIANTRATWLHQQSARIAKSYDLIAVEDLNVSGMSKHPTLARSIADASWSKFLGMVEYKAERAGAHFVTVDPRNTSQKCSGCAELVPKSLAVRTHACPSCGLTIDRDHNASLNILAAVVGGGAGNVTHQGVRRPRNITVATP